MNTEWWAIARGGSSKAPRNSEAPNKWQRRHKACGIKFRRAGQTLHITLNLRKATKKGAFGAKTFEFGGGLYRGQVHVFPATREILA